MSNFVPRRSLPPLNAVRAFEAAARLGSLKEAAVELSVTHGAVSQQIRLLEDWLGAPALFRRSVRRVVLTPAGAALLAEFGPALDRISAAVHQHRSRRHDAPSIVLNVNALATFSLRWLLRRMGAFRAEHSDIEIRLSTSNETIDALAESFDVVIRGGPDTFPGYTSRFLFGERRLPVCSQTLLHTSSMPRLWRDWLAEAGEPALRSDASLTFDHFYLTLQAAIDGLGVAMGPTALIADDLAAGRLMTPFPDISLPARSYFAYLPEARRTDPHIAVFCDWLEQQGRDLVRN
jgi:LysR family glycine cleavage system transcriptional activator